MRSASPERIAAVPGAGDKPWHALAVPAALTAAGSDARRGLSEQEAGARRARHGANALPEPHRRSLIVVFLRQFMNPLIYLLLAAGAIAWLLGEVSDALVILIVVLLNSVIGALQEGRAERSIRALRRLAAHEALVLRDGREERVPARLVVPGDILILAAGDAVAADARLVELAALQVAEAALTGESLPVGKELRALPPETPLADRRNMVFSGTHVTAGRARALVVATGLDTEIGHISTLTASTAEPPTPLERRIDAFGRSIMVVAVVLFLLVLLVGWLRGVPFGELVMVAISQVVGMIPEGLPVAMTIALAVGVQRMARRRAIVRRLSAVETLGSTTVICSDKTGTLTMNEMTVTAIYQPGGRRVVVSGEGYVPVGAFSADGRPLDPRGDADLAELLEAGVLCSDASLRAPGVGEPRWSAQGDPTEAALLTLAVKGGVGLEELRARYPRAAEIPFDSATKMMAVQNTSAAGPRVILKGAPELVLELCSGQRRDGRVEALTAADRARHRAAVEGLAGDALRVLSLAVVEGATIDAEAGFAGLGGRATFLGLVGQMDPPRPEAGRAVAACRAAGIRPVMITGDHRTTGLAVALKLDIARPGDGVVEGAELERMSEADLAAQVSGISVFARVHPDQKLRIVRALQRGGAVVAMTGDGVNDAPALAQADVGVAMGATGTEVAKEAAKIVVTDDNFASIVAAVEEGRIVYRNIKKAILLLFSTSLAEVVILLAALLIGYPPPFAAVQILWNNLVTEGVITINLIMDPAEGDEMSRPPTPPDEPLITRLMFARFLFLTPAIVISTLGWFIVRLSMGVPFPQVQSETFTVLAVCEWFNVLNCRSETASALSLSLFRNPWLVGGLVVGNALQAAVIFLPSLNRVFHTVPFSLREVVAIGAVASLVLWVEEIRKFWRRRRLREVRAT